MVRYACGIGKVHMLGEKEDWEKINIKLENMKKYIIPELSLWLNKLSYIIN
jgi:hypothetical protein